MAQPTLLPILPSQAAGPPSILAPADAHNAVAAHNSSAIASTSVSPLLHTTTLPRTGEQPTAAAIMPTSRPTKQPPATSSPTSARKPSLTTTAATNTPNDHIPPLTHPSRTTPLHPNLPLPALLPDSNPDPSSPNNPPSTTNTQTHTLNPLTLLPFTPHDLSTHDFTALLASCRNARTGEVDQELVKQKQEEAIAQIRERVKEREVREKEVEREVAEMEKIREVERKVWRRKMGGRGEEGRRVKESEA